MEEPKYVIRSNETMLYGEYRTPFDKVVRQGIYAIVGIMILFKLIFGFDLYGELSSLPRMMLGLSIVYTLLYGKKNMDHVSPLEIQIYQEYLVIYEEKRFYRKALTRKNICKMYYKDITSIEFDAPMNRMYFFGSMDITWYDYNKDNTLPDVPTQHKYVEDTLWHFRLYEQDGESIISSLKEYASINVIDKKTKRSLS